MWLVILLALLFYWSQLYLDRSVAGFHADVPQAWPDQETLAHVQPYDPTGAIMARGKFKYEQTCAACHGLTGLGTPNVAPPFAGSEWVTTPGPGRIARVAYNGLKGPIEVAGKQYVLNPMLAGLALTMSQEDLAALLSYVRNSWGNKASLVTPEQVKEIYEKILGRSEPWTSEELKAIPENE